MKKITILHVHAAMNRGGVESIVMNILRYIDRDRFSFIFLCVEDGKYDYEDELTDLGAKVIRTPRPRDIGMITYLRTIRRIMHEENVDIVHAHSNMVLSLIAAKIAGVKARLAHAHITGTENVPNAKQKAIISISKIIVNLFCTDRVACGEDAGRYLFGNRDFEIVYNGIVLDNYSFSESNRSKVRKKLNLPKSATVIGHIGRMVPFKNQRFLIDVFAQYAKLNPNSYLLLIGGGYQQTENQQYAKKYNVAEKIIFLGNREDANKFYDAMDVFVLPSTQGEGLGMVVVEAQANGLRCLVSDKVPSEVKLTEGVEFLSLDEGTQSWANRLSSISISRFDALKALKHTPYNIELGVKDVEEMYSRIGEGR